MFSILQTKREQFRVLDIMDIVTTDTVMMATAMINTIQTMIIPILMINTMEITEKAEQKDQSHQRAKAKAKEGVTIPKTIFHTSMMSTSMIISSMTVTASL
jgi:hypothetical protein